MRHLYYAGNSVIVADITCKAVLRYARALANVGKSDIAEVPVIDEGGSNGWAHILIGPASQIFSTPIANSSDEPIDMAVIEELERLTRTLLPTAPAWPEEMKDIPDVTFEWDDA